MAAFRMKTCLLPRGVPSLDLHVSPHQQSRLICNMAATDGPGHAGPDSDTVSKSATDDGSGNSSNSGPENIKLRVPRSLSAVNMTRLSPLRPLAHGRTKSSNYVKVLPLVHSVPTSPAKYTWAAELRLEDEKPRLSLGTWNHAVNDKNRLVNQFYNAINDMGKTRGGSNNSSVADMRQLLSRTGPQMQQPQPVEASAELLDAQFDKIIANGGYEYTPMDVLGTLDEKIVRHFLKICSILGNEHAADAGLQPLRDILESTSGRFLSQSRHSLLNDPISPRMLVEINTLQQYLQRLYTLVEVLLNELVQNKDLIRGRYRQEINDNISKLSDLVQTLDTLETRLESSKQLINANKGKISDDFDQKLAVLEQVHKRYREHSQGVHDRRFMQLGVAVALIVVGMGVYWMSTEV